MLNYIWVGLLVVAMLFAMGADLGDITGDRYRNGKVVGVTVTPADVAVGTPQAVRFVLSPADYKAHYGVDGAVDAPAVLARSGEKLQLSIKPAGPMPAPFDVVLARTKTDAGEIVGEVRSMTPDGVGALRLEVVLPSVLIVKLAGVGEAAIETAKTAVTLALGLIGVLSLWLGLMRIAEKSGLVELMVGVVRPVLAPLFPGVPRNHPAMGMIALNLSANMLGLSNAATPFGIRAMEELQKLNPKKDTATNAMVMLLALNTAGVQLMPSATLLAVMGLQAAVIYFPMLLVTALCAVVAIVAVFALQPFFKVEEPLLTEPLKAE
jgi:spore maturation protein A